MKLGILTSILILLLSSMAIPQVAVAQGQIIYVDADATGDKNGSSWEHALTSFQDGLAAAIAGDDIWVAAGTYTPTAQIDPGDARSATFQMKNGVGIYGGFDPSVEDDEWAERDWESNSTVLSGDIGSQGEKEGGIQRPNPTGPAGNSAPTQAPGRRLSIMDYARAAGLVSRFVRYTRSRSARSRQGILSV